MSDLVRNLDCWFSHAKAQLSFVMMIFLIHVHVHNYNVDHFH